MKQIFLLCLLVIQAVTQAQSYHFSQFYSTPSWINPALTGNIEGSFRGTSNYRSQWGSGGVPFTTISVSGDVRLLRNKLAEGNKLGLGIAFLSDKTMNSAVQSNAIALSTAYNIVLDPDMIHSIGLGFQGVYHERKINFNSLSFENQLGSNGFDLSLPIGEPLIGGTRGFVDINVGALYKMSQTDKSLFAGLAVYNLLREKSNFQQQEFSMPIRLTAMAGGDLDIGYSGILYFSLHHQQQGGANETTLGSAYGIQLGTEKKQVVSAGVWYRLNDALIPYLGYQVNGFQAGFSYDYTVSKLKTNGQVKNGYEISLIYASPDNRELKRLVPWY
jgi:type IX secretion system PorP/SprF family membrane protein